MPHLLKRAILLAGPLVAAIFLLLSVQTAFAKPPANYLQVTLYGTNSLYMDSNNWCTGASQSGPDGAWYTIVLTNTTNNQTYTGLQLSIATPSGVAVDDPVHYVGNLEAGHAKQVHFFVDYRTLRNWPGCKKADPPISYNKAITLTVVSLDGGMTGIKIQNTPLQAEGLTGASSGGQYISHQISSSAYVGELITMTTTYAFGASQNDTLFIQPTGNGSFQDNCFRLVETRVLHSIVEGVSAGQVNQIWFPGSSPKNNDVVEMLYTFQALCADNSTQTYPWSTLVNNQNQKYNAQTYGASGPVHLPIPKPVSSVLSLSQSVTPTVLRGGGTAVYTVRVQNTANVPIAISVMNDWIPNGVSYIGFHPESEVTAANSSISPTLGMKENLAWYGIPYVTYNVPPSGTLGSGAPGVLELIYTANITRTVGLYTSQATILVGNETIGPAKTMIEVKDPTAVTLATFNANLLLQGGVQLTWKTAMEVDCLGFNVYRGSQMSGKYEQLNQDMVPAQGLGSISGASYSWDDTSAKLGMVYTYWLDEIDIRGNATRYGPVMVITGQWLYLPMIGK